ncbi:hypothetical protein [Corynebacterium sp.]|uniref:hypothetical protein n=1 Tax=Corynebacterium sp. TaxID=1720 RepID=UPI0037C177AF
MVRPVRNVRECLALDGEPGVSVAGRTYAAVMSADTLFITIPTGVGVDIHVKILENFAAHVASALSWQPNREGPVIGYPID